MINTYRRFEFITEFEGDKEGDSAKKRVLKRKKEGLATYISYIHDESVVHIWDHSQVFQNVDFWNAGEWKIGVDEGRVVLQKMETKDVLF